jgi:hypothetical protein
MEAEAELTGMSAKVWPPGEDCCDMYFHDSSLSYINYSNTNFAAKAFLNQLIDDSGISKVFFYD